MIWGDFSEAKDDLVKVIGVRWAKILVPSIFQMKQATALRRTSADKHQSSNFPFKKSP